MEHSAPSAGRLGEGKRQHPCHSYQEGDTDRATPSGTGVTTEKGVADMVWRPRQVLALIRGARAMLYPAGDGGLEAAVVARGGLCLLGGLEHVPTRTCASCSLLLWPQLGPASSAKLSPIPHCVTSALSLSSPFCPSPGTLSSWRARPVLCLWLKPHTQ